MNAQVDVQSGGRWLRIQWQEESAIKLSAEHLRSHCRCASCRADHMRDRFHPDPCVRLRDVRPFGVAGLHLVFSDGHSRGVFPWQYLRELASETVAGAKEERAALLPALPS